LLHDRWACRRRGQDQRRVSGPDPNWIALKEDAMPARKKASRKAARPAARKKTAPRKKATAAKKPSKKAAPRRKPAAAAPGMAATVPNSIGAMVHHIDYTTHDPEGVRRFYTQLLGFSKFDHDSQFSYLWIQTGQSSSIGFMPPMAGMGEASPAKEPTLYFMVKDVDRAYQALSAKGVMFEGPPADMPWGHRVVRTADPEGRTIMLATRKS
jgi:predicted enzyme related to lactoylglutathione lyase